jgi:hypothetical protein
MRNLYAAYRLFTFMMRSTSFSVTRFTEPLQALGPILNSSPQRIKERPRLPRQHSTEPSILVLEPSRDWSVPDRSPPEVVANFSTVHRVAAC